MKLYKKPKLSNPMLIAAWPGMGFLAKISVDYLRDQLKADFFADVDTPRGSVFYEDGIVELPPIKHRFYYHSESNLMICSGEAQPISAEEIHKLGNKVMDVAQKFNVKRVFTVAAFPAFYAGKPMVFGVVNKPELRDYLNKYGVKLVKDKGGITGLNGILIGIAKQRDVEGICLLGQIRYPDLPQPRSAYSILEVLTKMLGVEVNMNPLKRHIASFEEIIRRRIVRSKEEELRRQREDMGYVS